MATKEPVYCPDTSSLINIHLNDPKRLRIIGRLIKKGRVKIPSGVRREIKKKSDPLSHSLSTWLNEPDAEVNPSSDRRVRSSFADIQTRYGEEITVGNRTFPGFFKGPRGRRSADAEVVAISKVYDYVAVSDDEHVRLTCMLENVQCITWQEFLRQIYYVFKGEQASFL